MTLHTLLWAIASFVVLACVFGPLERAHPARTQAFLRPGFGVDVCFFFGQYLVFSALALVILGWVHGLVAAPRILRDAFLLQPFVLQVVEAIVLGDVLVYWFHRACHAVPLLWRFHAVHHSTEQLDWLAAHREHPLDGLFTQLFQNLPAMLLGLHIELLGALVVFRGASGIFIHSNVDLSLGPLRYVIGEPRLHHWHHARLDRTAHNFANLAPWLDVVFGTYHRPVGEERYLLGLTQPWPRGYLGQLIRPLFSTKDGAILRAPWGSDLTPSSVPTAANDGFSGTNT